ncbi:hypothetical protein J2X31_003629 [Flavobacterium arsenatis]|uniref:Lipoprotein n=1 Tax=Flavobacterium arsenatis TaxID=1484332 RepID=A0ABU1TUQ5_9FLAO|nr:hypothetical protein [Flavobacterium arsenatis]MDR6969596.1 hypothetical protein [Flavobacterium arsenatis]
MIKLLLLGFLFFLFSCNDSKNEKQPSQAIKETIQIAPKKVVENAKTYNSSLRPKQALQLKAIYTDTVTFADFMDGGDYPLLFFYTKNDRLSFIYQTDENITFNRGDQLLINWKIDSTWIAGEGETLEFHEWITSAKKIKDGNVTAFRKKYTKPIKYWYSKEETYSDTFKDYLYRFVEYYLANTKNELVLLNLKANENLVYSIEDGKKNGRSYTILGLSTEMEDHSSIIVWLYLDNETRKFYEYDLGNDKLIEFK